MKIVYHLKPQIGQHDPPARKPARFVETDVVVTADTDSPDTLMLQIGRMTVVLCKDDLRLVCKA